MSLIEIAPEQIRENMIKMVGSDWMLISAGEPSNFNTMTASWGGFGMLWNKPVAWCVVRPQRYTYEFMERNGVYSLSFLGEEYREALWVCGSKSGRDLDKVKEAGITPVAGKTPGTTVFAEARIVVECKKLYNQDIDPAGFIDPDIESNYPEKDYHRMYIGEIAYCGVKE